MWWRFLTFCVLVTFVLFVVLSCIHGRPVIHLFFHRCCEEDIENDQVIFENFGGNNFLRERLVGADIVDDDNDSFVTDVEAENVIKAMRDILNVHNPESRVQVYGGDKTANATELNEAIGKLDIELRGHSEDVDKQGNKTDNENLNVSDIIDATIIKDDVKQDSSESTEATTENRLKAQVPMKLLAHLDKLSDDSVEVERVLNDC